MLDSYFRSAAALSDAPPLLPVNLAALGDLAGESGKFREFSGLFSKNPRNFGNPRVQGLRVLRFRVWGVLFMVWVLSGGVGGGWFWGAEGLGLWGCV